MTGLIQPETITGGHRERELFLAELDKELFATGSHSGASTPRNESPAPFGRPPRSTVSGRRTKLVSYAEKESSDEEEDEESELEEPASDPEDDDYGGTGRRRRDAGLRSERTLGTPIETAMTRRLRRKKEDMDKGWTWLGGRTPGERVKSVIKNPTRHVWPCVSICIFSSFVLITPGQKKSWTKKQNVPNSSSPSPLI